MGVSSDRLMQIAVFALVSYTLGALWAVHQILKVLESIGGFAS